MNLFRLTLAAGGLLLLGSGLSSCLKAPEYSTTPAISFNSFVLRRVNFSNPKQQPIDSAFITINFQDGDGDLGLNQAERRGTKDSINYYIEPFIKSNTGKYVSTVALGLTKTGDFNGTFDHPTAITDGKAAPIKGTLRRTIGFGYGDYFTAGQTIRFEISIADRARHLSNTIRTDSAVVAPR